MIVALHRHALVALTTSALAVSAGAALDRLAAGEGLAPTGRVAAQGVPAPVTLTLFSSEVAWRTVPNHWVTVDVAHVEGWRDDGRGNTIGQRSHGYGRADGHGDVVVRLSRSSGGSSGGLFRPFDALTLTHATFTATVGAPYTVSVPELRVDVAAEGEAIVGRAAPGSTVTLVIDAPPGPASSGTVLPTEAAVTADAAGAFAWAVPAGLRLAPGQGGWATVEDAAGNRFRARFAALAVRLVMGAGRASGWLTPADALTVTYGTRAAVGRDRRSRLVFGVDDVNGQRSAGPPSLEIAPGTFFTVAVGSPMLGARAFAHDPLPKLAVDELAASHAAGGGPPGSTLAAELYAPDVDAWAAPEARVPVTVGTDGRWRADFAPRVVQAGGRVAVVLDVGEAIAVAAEAVRPRYTVAIDGARIGAVLMPGTSYRVTARAPDGRLIARSRPMPAGRDGNLSREGSLDGPPNLPEGALSVVVRGGSLEVDHGEGSDPELLAVPDLLATSDAVADAFRGTAPPGAALAVEVMVGAERRTFAVTAGPDGSWNLPLAGQVDIVPGVGARVWLTDDAGHRYYVDTAPVRIVARPDSGYLSAAPWTGRPYRAEVRDPAGRVVAAIDRYADHGPEDDERHLVLREPVGNALADVFGQRPLMEAGDAIHVSIGDDEARWVLPPLEGRIDPDRDLVVGQTDPGAELVVIGGELDDALAVVVTTTAGADGRFVADLAGRHDIPYGGAVHVRRDDSPHRLERQVYAPAVVVDYERATVSGVAEPRVAVVVRLVDGTRVRAEGRDDADGAGRYDAVLRDPAGNAVVPREGERIEVTAPNAELVKAIAIDLPPLHIDVAPDRRSLSGPRPSDAYFSASASLKQERWPDGDYFNSVRATLGLTESARWQMDLSRPLPPGYAIRISAHLPSGHLLRRSYVAPMVAIENGGARACGMAQPYADVALSLHAADGTPRAAHRATAGTDGLFALEWRDAQGQPVFSRALDRVVGRVGDTEIAVPIDPMTATIDVAAQLLRAQIRPGAHPEASAPARDCLFNLSSADRRFLEAAWLLNWNENYGFWPVPSDGRIELPLPPPEVLARGMDLHFETADEHRLFRTVYRPLLLAADVATGELSGQATPGARVDLVLRGLGGVTITQASTTADPTGAFAVRFERAQLADGTIVEAEAVAGSFVTLLPSATVTASMTVERLDLDPSGAALLGQAPPGRTIELTLDVRGVGERWIALRAGEDGRFALRAEDVPPRSGWSLGDVDAGRAELVQPEGHRTVASWRAGDAPGGRWVVHLPFGLATATTD